MPDIDRLPFSEAPGLGQDGDCQPDYLMPPPGYSARHAALSEERNRREYELCRSMRERPHREPGRYVF